MKTASQHFSDEQRQHVNAAVADAEAHTAAEIVPVVATASGRYDRAEDIVGLWLGGIALTLVWALVPDASAEAGDWSGVSSAWKLVAMLAALVIGFVAGAVIADKVHALRRLFTPKAQMRDEVSARARQVFFDSTVHHTTGATGLLIFISLYEHQAVILADQHITEKLGQDTLDALCKDLTASLHTAPIPEALLTTIKSAGEKLAPVLPRETHDENELPDSLVLIDDVA